MSRIKVICGGCGKLANICRQKKICKDLPETESHWHESNRWKEEMMRFFGTDNVVKFLRFWRIIK